MYKNRITQFTPDFGLISLYILPEQVREHGLWSEQIGRVYASVCGATERLSAAVPPRGAERSIAAVQHGGA